MMKPQQLRRPGRRLHDQLPSKLLVKTIRSPRIGNRLNRKRQIGGRTPHHRSRRIELRIRQLNHMPKLLKQTAEVGIRSTSDAKDSLANLNPNIRHHPNDLRVRKSNRNGVQRSCPKQRNNHLDGFEILHNLTKLRWLHSKDHQIGALSQLSIRTNRLPTKLCRKLARPSRT